MSIIHIRNSKGPTLDPWSTPHVTLKREVLVSAIFLHWTLLSK